MIQNILNFANNIAATDQTMPRRLLIYSKIAILGFGEWPERKGRVKVKGDILYASFSPAF